MSGGAILGLSLGLAFTIVQHVAPQPIGDVVWWACCAGQLAWCAFLTWRRTALPFATASMITGAVMSICLAAISAGGDPLGNLRPESWILLGGGLSLGPLFLLIESRVHRARWAQWARFMERRSAWDIVRGRHIPELRTGSL